jgi:hypothetical protein
MNRTWTAASLLLASTVAGASKSELVAPVVKTVVTAPSIRPNGDFYRAILFNSEADACLRIDTVNLRKPGRSQIKGTGRYCSFEVGQTRYSLLRDRHQASDIGQPRWKNSALEFDLSYTPKGTAAPTLELSCTIDMTAQAPSLVCGHKG